MRVVCEVGVALWMPQTAPCCYNKRSASLKMISATVPVGCSQDCHRHAVDRSVLLQRQKKTYTEVAEKISV